MKLLMLFGLTMILITGFIASITTPVSAQNPCTASNPCQQICGDHICAPGEYAAMQAAKAQSQIGNKTTSTPSNITSGNIAITSPSTGAVVAGVVSYMATASDGTIVIVRTGHSIPGQPLSLGIAFYTSNKNAISNQNYAIIVSQDGVPIFSKPSVHSNTGIDTLTTFTLTSADPISLQVTLNGIGPSTADPSTWSGVKGEVLSFSQPGQSTPPTVQTTNMTTQSIPPTTNMTTQSTPPVTQPASNVTTAQASNNSTVPEFGSVASTVLAISVLGIVFAARSRMIPKL